MKKIKILLAIAIIILIVIIFSALLLKKKVIENPEGLISQMKDLADLRLQSIHLTENSPGGARWELTAETARYFREGNYALLERINIIYYDKKAGKITLTSNSGKMNMETRNVEVYGNVILTYGDLYVLRGDSLKFDSKEKKINSDGPVSLEGPRIKLKGIGISIDLNTETLSILKDVHSLIDVSEKK
jgi:LPS export ABC transporter protein LptC